MKQKIVMLVIALCVVTNVWAQDTPMVTLQNDTETKVFYGSDSFKEAMKVANHGDIITLSSGIFNAPVITKVVSIYGAGAKISNDNVQTGLTQINGNMYIRMDSISGAPATGFYMEGLFFNSNEVWVEKPLKSASLVKCRFNNINFNKNDSVYTKVESEMVHFYQCRIAKWLEPGSCNGMTVYNSVINNIGANKTLSTINIKNSVVYNVSWKLYNARFENCYIYHAIKTEWHSNTNNNQDLNSSCSALNVVYGTYILEYVTSQSNCWYVGSSSVFKSGSTTSYSDAATYELTSTAKANYIGTDGKPIGLYGGDYPYNTKPSMPYVVEKNIATKSENGKLKVSIKVAVPGSNL